MVRPAGVNELGSGNMFSGGNRAPAIEQDDKADCAGYKPCPQLLAKTRQH